MPRLWPILLLLLAMSGPARAAPGAGLPSPDVAAPALDALIERFGAGAPTPPGRVSLDAWVEADGDGAGREVVIVLQPEGPTKLVADPGITVTPEERAGVQWEGPLPRRLVDPGLEYFAPPAALRLPFTAADDQPIRVLVEYAYCVVDFQCFFGEETLTVANRVD